VSALALHDSDVDYRALAWSKFIRELDEDFRLGPIERIRGIPELHVLRRSIEWAVWRSGRTWDVLFAQAPKRKREPNFFKRLDRKRRRALVSGAGGSTLW